MHKTMLTLCLMAGVAMAGTAMAQSGTTVNPIPGGKKAGDFMVRGRVLGVIPLDSSSSVSAIGGHVSTSASVTPEVDFSYFLTDNIALEVIAATSKHYLEAKGTAAGTVKVGSTWVLPPAVTVQYHFMPKERFSPYLGTGLNYTIFYSTSAAAGLSKLSLTDNLGYVVQAGFDYALTERMYLNVDVKQMFLSTKARVNSGAVTAKTNLNPLVIGAGVGWRF